MSCPTQLCQVPRSDVLHPPGTAVLAELYDLVTHSRTHKQILPPECLVHCIFHQCHCSDTRSCQTTLKWLFSPHGVYVMHSVEQIRTLTPSLTHWSLFQSPTNFYFRCELKVTPLLHHLPQSPDYCEMTFLYHVHALDLFLKSGNRKFYFIEITSGQMTFTLLCVAKSSFRHPEGRCHRKLRGYIKLSYIISLKCQLLSA